MTTIRWPCIIKSKTMELIRMYDTNEDVLVAKKSVVGVEEGRCYSAK